MKKRITSLFLALLVLASVTACGKTPSSDAPGKTDDAAQQTTAAVETTLPPETKPVAEVPDTDAYKDYEFRILARIPDELIIEELTAEHDSLDEAVYRRNRMVEEKYGIKYVQLKMASGDVYNAYINAVAANEDSYDLVGLAMEQVGGAVNRASAMPIEELPYIDIEKPWWDTETIKSSAIYGKSFFLTGDFGYHLQDSVGALVFNKTLMEKNSIAMPYDIVREGKWTYELLRQHCSNITRDLDGNTVLDGNDQWGLLSSNQASIAFLRGIGMTAGGSESDGALKYTLENEKNLQLLSETHNFFSDLNMQLKAETLPAQPAGPTW